MVENGIKLPAEGKIDRGDVRREQVSQLLTRKPLTGLNPTGGPGTQCPGHCRGGQKSLGRRLPASVERLRRFDRLARSQHQRRKRRNAASRSRLNLGPCLPK